MKRSAFLFLMISIASNLFAIDQTLVQSLNGTTYGFKKWVSTEYNMINDTTRGKAMDPVTIYSDGTSNLVGNDKSISLKYDNYSYYNNAALCDPVPIRSQIPIGAYDIRAYIVTTSGSSGSKVTVVTLPSSIKQYIDNSDFTQAYGAVAGASTIGSVDVGGTHEYEVTVDFSSNKLIAIGARMDQGTGVSSVSYAIKVTYKMPITITVQNYRQRGRVDAFWNNAPYNFDGVGTLGVKDNQNVILTAVPNQNVDGYNMAWNSNSKWERKFVDGAPELMTRNMTYNFNILYNQKNTTYTAYILRQCNLALSCYAQGSTVTPGLIFNGQSVTSGTSVTLVEESQGVLDVQNASFENNKVLYTFDRWENGSTTRPRTVSTNEHANYTAIYKGTPIYPAIDRKMNVTNAYRSNPVLSWSAHSNPSVNAYKIFRKVIKGPNLDPGSQIATVYANQPLTYTDWEYFNNGSQLQDEIFYSVDASIESQGTSPHNWEGLYFGILIKSGDSTYASNHNKNLDNALSNYPNPFNPTTQISYSLKENGRVQLQVFDILGNRVADLVNEYQSAGTHKVNFDGSNKPSGIYICTIKANNFTKTQKMLLVK